MAKALQIAFESAFKKNLFAHSLFGHQWKVCHKYIFQIPKLLNS